MDGARQHQSKRRTGFDAMNKTDRRRWVELEVMKRTGVIRDCKAQSSLAFYGKDAVAAKIRARKIKSSIRDSRPHRLVSESKIRQGSRFRAP